MIEALIDSIIVLDWLIAFWMNSGDGRWIAVDRIVIQMNKNKFVTGTSNTHGDGLRLKQL